MKKCYGIMLCVIVMFAIFSSSMVYPVFAMDFQDTYTRESVEDDDAFLEIASLQEAIVDRVNHTLTTENEEHSYSSHNYALISAEDIQFNNMYKEYLAPDIITKNLTGDIALANLWSCDYIWVLPVHVEDITITIRLQRGIPLNESVAYAMDENGNRILEDESIEKIKAQEEKWKIISSSIDFRDTRYEDVLDKMEYSVFRTNDLDASIGSVVYFITIPELHSEAAVVLSQETNYYCLLPSSTSYNLSSSISWNGFIEQDVLKEQIDGISVSAEYDMDGNILYGGGYVSVDSKEANHEIPTLLLCLIIFLFCTVTLIIVNTKFLKNKKIPKQECPHKLQNLRYPNAVGLFYLPKKRTLHFCKNHV